jgi:hypothetical protein
MPAPTKVSGNTVVDLTKWGVDASPYATDRYFYDESGNIYKETSGGTWSVDRSGATIGNGAAGQGLALFDDFLYYMTSTTIGRKGKLSGTPSYNDDFLSDDTTDKDQSNDGTGQTYNVTTSIDEGTTHRQTFTPNNDPVKSIEVDVNTKGTTADWTLTLHDTNNVSLGTVTIANGDLSVGLNKFEFSTPPRVVIGNEYHFHLTVTNTTGLPKVVTGTSGDLEDAFFNQYFGILIAATDFHPALEHLNFLAIGNGNYVANWNRATYDPNAISVKPGFKVRTLTKWNEFLVIGCWQGDSTDEVESARLYYWDGVADSFNFFDDLPMGLPHTMFDVDGVLMGVFGDEGLLAIREQDKFTRIHKMPKLARGKRVEVFPGAVTQWQLDRYIGVAGSTDDATFRQGVYRYGTQNDQIARSLTYAFDISTGNTKATTTKVGMVAGFGKDMYIGWEDDGSYGVDKVSRGDNAYSAGSLESLIFDDSSPQKEKLALRLVVTFEPLTTGQSITLKYKMDRNTGGFTNGETVNTVGETRAELNFADEAQERFREIELGFSLASSSNTYIMITGMWFEFDNLEEEEDAS